jgi:D-glycero-D-manno-heptose 1,7-bisphosphate phosphatase
MRQAIILGGGMGTRLGALTADRPKPLLDVGGRRFIDYLTEHLVRHGVKHLIILVGPHTAAYRAAFDGAGLPRDVRLSLVADEPPAGTAGALRYASNLLDPEFLLINGDSYFDFNILDLATEPGGNWLGRIALRPIEDTGRYGAVRLDGDRITAFGEKSSDGPGLINTGVYRLRREIVPIVEATPSSIETDIFPHLAQDGRLAGRIYDGRFIDIGLPDTFAQAQTLLPEWRRRPAAFLDRDGILNHDTGYVWQPENYHWMDGAGAAVKRLNDLGYYVFVVTNQAGVARGLYRAGDVEKLHAWINDRLRREGAHIDAFYYCPHHPDIGDGPLTMNCDCRKPLPGMLHRAMAEWPVDLSRSFMIGDKNSDMEAAAAAEVPTRLLFTGGDIFGAIESIAPALDP